MLRPTRRDDCVRRRAAELALPRVKQWMGADTAGYSDEDMIRKLMTVIGGSDGFQIAKDLDRAGWSADSELVEIMDSDYIRTAEREMVKQWVKCLGVKLAIPVGAVVKIRHGIGVVTAHEDEFAEYHVRTPDLKNNAWYTVAAENVQIHREGV